MKELEDVFKTNKDQLEQLRTGLDQNKNRLEESVNPLMKDAASVMDDMANPYLNVTHLRKLLSEFTVDSIFWNEAAAFEDAPPEVSGLIRFIVRVFNRMLRLRVKIWFLFHKE
jgi:hypothetical protein